MRLLYVPNLKLGNIELSSEESQHAFRVLRAKVGDEYLLIDGTGGRAKGSFIEINKKSCVLHVSEIETDNRTSPKLTMVVAPTKQTDRFEWFLEKAVEIGVEEIYPVWTERSERRVEKHERWNKILVSAMKQSQRSWLPQLHSAISINEIIPILQNEGQGKLCIAHCMNSFSSPDKKHILTVLNPGVDACIAIGPEGDFTENEVKSLLKIGGVEISLGNCRLRTETAAITSVTYFSAIQELG